VCGLTLDVDTTITSTSREGNRTTTYRSTCGEEREPLDLVHL